MSHFHRKISRKSALECEGVKLPFRREISNIFFLFFGDLSVFLGQKKQSEDLFDYFKYMQVMYLEMYPKIHIFSACRIL